MSRRQPQLLANRLAEGIAQFRVTRNSRHGTCRRIAIQIVFAACAIQFTPVRFEVADEFSALHGRAVAGTASVITTDCACAWDACEA